MGGHWNVSIQLQQLKKKANNWEKSQTCIAWLAGSRWIHSNLLRCLLNLVLAAPLIILPPTSVTALLKERRSIWDTGTWRNCKFSSSNFSKSFQGFLNVNSAISFPSPPFRFWNSFFLFHDSSHSVNELAHREKTSSCQPSTSIKQVLHPPDRLPERPLQNLHILLTVCKLCANCANCANWYSGILFCACFFCFFIHFARYSLRHTLHSVQKWCKVWLGRDFPHSQSSSRHSWVAQLILHCTRISICIWETGTDLLSWVAIKTWFLATFETRFPRLGDQTAEDRQ